MPPDAARRRIRGTCPGVSVPIEAGDGMLLRVRLPGGVVSASGLRTVAAVAERWGTGTVELTARANLQIRGVDPADVGHAAARLIDAGLADADAGRDGRRDVVASPLTGHDAAEVSDLSAVVSQVAAALAAEPGLDALPPKFGVVIDAGGAASVRAMAADIALGAVATADGSVLLRVELGRALDHPDATGAAVALGDAVAVVLAVARCSATEGARMGEVVERHRRPAVLEAVLAGTSVRVAPALPALRCDPSERVAGQGTPPIGPIPHPLPGLVNVGGAPLLGRAAPAPLRTIAELSDATGAAIRLTPWRGAVLAGVSEPRAASVATELDLIGFSTRRDDPAHLVSACVGRPGCGWSRADTAGAARELLDGPEPLTERIHLAGCDKRCGAGTAPVAVADDRGRFTIEAS